MSESGIGVDRSAVLSRHHVSKKMPNSFDSVYCYHDNSNSQEHSHVIMNVSERTLKFIQNTDSSPRGASTTSTNLI